MRAELKDGKLVLWADTEGESDFLDSIDMNEGLCCTGTWGGRLDIDKTDMMEFCS